MNAIYLKSSELIEPDLYKVTDPYRLDHLQNVIKAQEGQLINLVLINKGMGQGEILGICEDKALIKVNKHWPGQDPWFDLIIGLSRPPTLKKILEHATCLGARSFHFIPAQLSEKSYASSKIFEEKNLEKLLLLGLSQSATYFQLPKVCVHKVFNPEKIVAQNCLKFVLHPGAGHSFMDMRPKFHRPLALAIGPERGWTHQEFEIFQHLDFTPTTISSSILRVEIATFTALGQLEMLRFQVPNRDAMLPKK